MEAITETIISPYDVAEHLRTPKDMAAYLQASIKEADGDDGSIAKALGDIARAKGMSQVASDAGLSRESLYKALSGARNPTLDTILRVVSALGLRPRAEAVDDGGVAGASGYPVQPDRARRSGRHDVIVLLQGPQGPARRMRSDVLVSVALSGSTG